ncbi:MAG: hypothetical protein JWR06_247 [Jatrophihabitans sp.]|nr:hypothetical protein [Jatrophihabitans sp.]
MADRDTKARAMAIKDFAAVLRELREAVGNPAFREMSGRSRIISHTTLHEAAQGNRLPSWATTVEFVKACGADPSAYRERWEQASEAVRSASAVRADAAEECGAIQVAGDPEPMLPSRDTRASGGTPGGGDAGDEMVADDGTAAPSGPPGRRSLRRYVLPGVAVAVVAAVAVPVVLLTQSGGANHAGVGRSPSQTAQLAPADCPVHQANPPAAKPANPGDAGAFIADITLPDCGHIHRGQKVTKVWRFKNVGSVPWAGYSLHRMDLPQQRDQCQTISDVPIDDTAPGGLVDIKTEVTAPKKRGFCFARFKMVDGSGHIAFPGSRPVNFQVIVD